MIPLPPRSVSPDSGWTRLLSLPLPQARPQPEEVKRAISTFLSESRGTRAPETQHEERTETSKVTQTKKKQKKTVRFADQEPKIEPTQRELEQKVTKSLRELEQQNRVGSPDFDKMTAALLALNQAKEALLQQKARELREAEPSTNAFMQTSSGLRNVTTGGSIRPPGIGIDLPSPPSSPRRVQYIGPSYHTTPMYQRPSLPYFLPRGGIERVSPLTGIEPLPPITTSGAKGQFSHIQEMTGMLGRQYGESDYR